MPPPFPDDPDGGDWRPQGWTCSHLAEGAGDFEMTTGLMEQESLEITAAKPSWTTCLRSAARLNTTLPGGLEMVSVFAAQVETTKKTRHSCPTYKQWRTKVANVLMRFRLFEAVVHAPHLILPGAPCNMTCGACMTGSKRLQTLGLKAQT